MNGRAVPDQIRMSLDELLKGSLDREEIDIGNEAIDRGIKAGRLGPEHIPRSRNELSKDL